MESLWNGVVRWWGLSGLVQTWKGKLATNLACHWPNWRFLGLRKWSLKVIANYFWLHIYLSAALIAPKKISFLVLAFSIHFFFSFKNKVKVKEHYFVITCLLLFYRLALEKFLSHIRFISSLLSQTCRSSCRNMKPTITSDLFLFLFLFSSSVKIIECLYDKTTT